MKVGLLIYGSLDTLSGGYLYDRRLVRHLEASGDTVEIVSIPWRNYGRHLGDNLSPRLLKRLKGLDVDVLVQDELNHPSLFALNTKIKGRVPYPIVSIVHHLRCSELRPAWQNRFYRAVERRYLETVDGFVYNSQTTRGIVESLVPPKPNVVAHPGGDRLGHTATPEQIKTRAARTGPLRLLFFGNVIERKGLHTLLDALEQLPSDLWTLDVVGGLTVEPDHVAQIRRRAAALPGIRLHGAVFDDALIPFLAQSDALVLPSSYEGFGIVYLEAAAFGLPSIASAAGGATEIVQHGHNGYLLTPGDAPTLTQHLTAWASDRALLAEMSLAARTAYDGHPTWTQTAEAIRQFLLTQKNRP